MKDVELYYLKNAKKPDDLKRIGDFEKTYSYLQNLVKPFKIEAADFDELFPFVKKLQDNWMSLSKETFTNEFQKYKYILTNIDGEQRNHLLNFKDEYYDNPKKAKRWYYDLSKIIREDDGENTEAFSTLHEIYLNVTDKGDEDE
ncbi:hypothetical protein HPO65_23360 [Klebsiella pneumoniae]|uniref:hypothetical protein n=1 Tax=Klebsiella pneumoniae TaxID=573 RepID=UPI000E2CC771|nr:hypothetical protein [Klebsiella pneumoniae]MBD7030165.1 hypothetical protein [Klebsiella pneumoniae]SYT90468.1 Uncharacterised protein [Klebsiella pneumoniae]HBS1045484.1 hypothetical protein [Klebsiella pneumoniae]HBY4414935.1 hypothetical protein [Klebsiella pneumoniae]HBY8307938.1 hypothetical protein [Klebsiella pneumoniae]